MYTSGGLGWGGDGGRIQQGGVPWMVHTLNGCLHTATRWQQQRCAPISDFGMAPANSDRASPHNGGEEPPAAPAAAAGVPLLAMLLPTAAWAAAVLLLLLLLLLVGCCCWGLVGLGFRGCCPASGFVLPYPGDGATALLAPLLLLLLVLVAGVLLLVKQGLRLRRYNTAKAPAKCSYSGEHACGL